MAGRKGVVQISEIANSVLDPVLARRAGINTTLLGMWDDIVGPDFAECTRPEKIKWPRRASQDDGFQPGTLTIACEGARAVFLAHTQDQLIQRLNSMFGFPAIDRVTIIQKPVSDRNRHAKKAPELRPDDKKRLADMVSDIDDPKLREALTRLGSGVLGGTKGRR
ncbi:MAG: DciA family protein [Alphaproteobacteria bacterium]|nr:DciA family protein [Alphaproteobacteria bacterium]